MRNSRQIGAACISALLAITIVAQSAAAADIDAYFARSRVELAETGVEEVSESGGPNSKKAFLLSLLVPGAGELYAGAHYRAAGFIAAEALSWLAWASWRSKGGDLRADFRQYADQNWSEARYLEWQALNRSLGSPYFETHHLPSKVDDTQQYYELIGKYNQFVYGWSDVNVPLSAEEAVVSQLRSDARIGYEDQRNESNKYLKRASVVIGLTVVNHVISAIHASAYVRSREMPRAEKRVWVGVVPASPAGGGGVSALLTARF